MSYIGADELIFFNDPEKGIHTGGFSVKSIMLKEGISPIMTINNGSNQNGGSDKVSDLFNDLVVPNWAFSYHNKLIGGMNRDENKKGYSDNSDSEDDIIDDGVIDDDLHDKLLGLVKEHDTQVKNKKKNTKKNMKLKKNKTRKQK